MFVACPHSAANVELPQKTQCEGREGREAKETRDSCARVMAVKGGDLIRGRCCLFQKVKLFLRRCTFNFRGCQEKAVTQEPSAFEITCKRRVVGS